MISIPRLVWLGPPIILVIAIARLPYGYYTFTRIVTCAVATLIAILAYQERRSLDLWCILFAMVAVLFNPLIPIHLSRATWFYLDLGAAAVFTAHLIFVRQKVVEERTHVRQ